MRHKELAMDDARSLMEIGERLLWGREFAVPSSIVLDCVAKSNRSAYDCEFVPLAMDLGVPLIITDEPLITEFPDITVHLRDFIQERPTMDH